MKAQPRTTLSFKLDKAIYSPFSHLLQKGFLVETLTGSTIKNLLCEHFKVEENYLEDRITTIFLDGKPVDDVDKAMVKDGSVLALSAAMPGLVGSAFRRGGILAAFRSGITYQQEDTISDSDSVAVVTIKLFNLLVGELGPVFLKKGIIVNREDVIHVLDDRGNTSGSLVRCVKMGKKEMPYEQLSALNWSKEPEKMFFKVSISSDVE